MKIRLQLTQPRRGNAAGDTILLSPPEATALVKAGEARPIARCRLRILQNFAGPNAQGMLGDSQCHDPDRATELIVAGLAELVQEKNMPQEASQEPAEAHEGQAPPEGGSYRGGQK